MPGPFDGDDFGKGLDGLVGRAAEFLSKGREELLRQSRIGKVKLFDLTQLRRERTQLVLRLGEEAYRALQSGTLAREDLDRTHRRIVEMDERIAAKEAVIERIRREALGEPAPKPSAAKPKRRAPKKSLGSEDE